MINQIHFKLRKENIDLSMPLIDRLLIARDISPDLLEGNYNNLHDPYLMNDMLIAIMRILKARKKKEHVLIYGDYDCDGIFSTLELIKFLRSIGINCDYYIPDRLKDGYGMNMNSIFDIVDDDYTLVITVDCGITSFEEIDFLQSNGIDVIITDHHECKETLPNAYAILDTKRSDNEYPFKELCGAGVAFKLICALCDELELKNQEKEYIMYAAIATVADVMPLVDENRIIVKEGLKLIKETNSPAIKNLLRVIGKLENIEKLSSQDIAFYLAPLINASSRVGDIQYALDLFLTSDEKIIYENANKLHEFNTNRKEIEKGILDEAINQIMSNYDFESTNPIVVYGKNWHRGVIGIVASRLVEEFNRPSIILTKEENTNIYHGSCRTYKDINMLKMLDFSKEYIYKYGGHKGAAGLTVMESDLLLFINKLNDYSLKNFNVNDFIPEKIIDIEIKPNEITPETFNLINSLEPFGEKNKEPIFICRNLKTKVIKRIGTKEGFENAHLKITFSKPDNDLKIINGVGFFKGDYADMLPSGKNVDVVFKLSQNEWQGNKIVQLMIEAINFTPLYKDGLTIEEDSLYREDTVTIKDIIEEYGVKEDDLLPSKQEYLIVFKSIEELLNEPNNRIIITNLNYLASIITTKISYEINPFKLSRILEVLEESNNIYFKHTLFDNIIVSKVIDNKEKIRLTQTFKYKKNHNI